MEPIEIDAEEMTEMLAYYLKNEKSSPLDTWDFTVYGSIGEIEIERDGKKFTIVIEEVDAD